MIKIGSLNIDKMYLGTNDVKVYLGSIKVYPNEEPPTPPTPSGNCYEVIQTPIASYTSTTDSVYSFADLKWYMKNNLNQYEEYGIYETGTSLSDFTYYPNKLVAIGETEYQYQSNGWVEVGEYIDAQTTYEVINDSMALQGKTLPTTFKIPYADVETIGGNLDLGIRTENGNRLYITTDDYEYEGDDYYEGTVTNDGEYYYYSLPSEAPSSVKIQSTEYWNSDPIHLIYSSRQISVEYVEKKMPIAKVYNTVAEMEATTCPNVGINEYGVVGNNVYQFEESEGWVNKAKNSLKFVAKYNDNKVNVIECNTSNELSQSEIQPSYLSKDAMTEAYIGDCVTSIGDDAFWDCSSLTNVTIPSGVTSISEFAFYGCSKLTSITIPSGVTSIDRQAFSYCSSLTSVTIPSGVTNIGLSAFYKCSGLTSITINATTPPTLGGSGVFDNTNNCPIYVPSASVDAYKTATNWRNYASRIQAIPA